jgi:hypothetical protein
MAICRNIKRITRRHEWLADLFSLLAVALFFATLYFGIAYYSQVLNWISHEVFLYAPIAITAIILDIVLIFFFLNIGTIDFSNEEEGCFHTFKGRRAAGGSVGLIFNGWLHHIEQVGRKHR